MEEKPDHPLSDLTKMVVGEKQGSRASWIVMLVLLGGIVIAFAVLGIQLVLAKRRAAELAAELRRAQEGQKQALENAKLADNEEKRKAAQAEAKRLEEKAAQLKAEIDSMKADHASYVADLGSVTGWDNLNVVDGRDHDRG
jgi:uncharacterized protein HemX